MMNIQDIKEYISINSFLSNLGFKPKRVSGGETFYISPIRDSDTDASFAVNDKNGEWFDFGLGKGGNIIDLGLEIFKTKNVSEVIKNINQVYGNNFEFKKNPPIVKADKVSSHKVTSLKNIGNNYALNSYLASRGVLMAAKACDLLKEVYYTFTPESGQPKAYFGIGWKNRSGGYDVRSKYGKICIEKKDLLFKEGNTDEVLVFEGMFDYLTALELDKSVKNDNLIILNTTSMCNAAIELIKSLNHIKSVKVFFDHGKGGRKFTHDFSIALSNVYDQSYLYKGFDDYNEKLVNDLSKKKIKPWETKLDNSPDPLSR